MIAPMTAMTRRPDSESHEWPAWVELSLLVVGLLVVMVIVMWIASPVRPA
jgi:hypothetical protein